jgi:hypothetical protein
MSKGRPENQASAVTAEGTLSGQNSYLAIKN